MATVTARLNTAALQQLLQSPAGPVAQELMRRARRVENEAKRRCPVDTGRLRSSITTSFDIEGSTPVARVGTNVKYATYIHEGTGIFGPRRSPIRPKRGKYLVFRPRSSSARVFAREVRGTPATPFLLEALDAARG